MNKHSLASQGYKYHHYAGNGQHILLNDFGEQERWFANKNHASFGLKWRNTHLEFIGSVGAQKRHAENMEKLACGEKIL